MAKDAKEVITRAKQKIKENTDTASAEWAAKLIAMGNKEKASEGADCIPDDEKDKDDTKKGMSEEDKKDDDKDDKDKVTEGDDKEDDKKDKDDVKEGANAIVPDSKDDSDKVEEDFTDGDDEDMDQTDESYVEGEQPATVTMTYDPLKGLTVKEDVAAMFDGVDGLSEEFKNKVATIFEAALKSKITEAVTEVTKAANEALVLNVKAIQEKTEAKADEFLEFVVEEWYGENQIALEAAARIEIADGLINGLKSLLETHNIALPAEKVDLLDEKTQEATALKGEVNSLTEQLIAKNKEIFALQKDDAVAALSEGLAATQVEKFKGLVKDIDANDIPSFKEKAAIVKESYFGNKSKDKTTDNSKDATVISEDTDVNVARYAAGIAKINKNSQ